MEGDLMGGSQRSRHCKDLKGLLDPPEDVDDTLKLESRKKK